MRKFEETRRQKISGRKTTLYAHQTLAYYATLRHLSRDDEFVKMSVNAPRMLFLAVFFATLMTHSLSRAETTLTPFPTRKLLGGGVASNTPNAGNSPTYNQLPPPPPPSTLNQKVFKFAWNYVIDLISSRGAETAAIEQMKIEEKHQTLPKTNSESEFANTLTRMANALSTEKGLARIEHGLDDFSEIDSSVHDALCRSDAFVREFNQSSFDDSYVQAFPMDGEEILSGCYRGCILGNDWKTTIAKFYGIRRTLTFNSWRGKCFKKVVDEIDGSETTAVTNRIKLSYGPIVNALLGLNEPIELYKGDVEYDATSIFDGKAAIGINYSKFGHEFSKFRDEIREVYPGVYIGKMWMMPGLDLFPREDGTDSIFKVPENGTPQFAMNFMLMKENDDEDGTNAGSSSSVPN